MTDFLPKIFNALNKGLCCNLIVDRNCEIKICSNPIHIKYFCLYCKNVNKEIPRIIECYHNHKCIIPGCYNLVDLPYYHRFCFEHKIKNKIKK